MKTVHTDGNPGTGVPGSAILAAFLNAVNAMKFGGLDQDGFTTAFKNGGSITSPAGGELVVDASLGNYFEITGSNSISKVTVTGSVISGGHVVLKAVSGFTLVNDAATGFIVTGFGANVTLAAGDMVLLFEYTANKWACLTRPATPNLLGSTNGNILRKAFFSITKHASGGINVQSLTGVGRSFNSLANIDGTASGNIAKGGNATVGSGNSAVTYSLNATGDVLIVNLAENVFGILSLSVDSNNGGTPVILQPSTSSNNIVIQAQNPSTGAAIDLTSLTPAGNGVAFHIEYVIGGAA